MEDPKGGCYGPPALFTGCVTIKPSKLFNTLLDWVLFTEHTHTHTLGRPHKGGCYGPPVRAAHDQLASAKAPFFSCLSVKMQPFFLIGCFTIQPSKLLNTLWALVHVKHTFLEDPTKVDTMGHQPFSPDVSLSSPQNYSTRYWTGFFSQNTHTHTPLEDPTKVDAMGHQFAQRMISLRLLKHPSSVVCQ